MAVGNGIGRRTGVTGKDDAKRRPLKCHEVGMKEIGQDGFVVELRHNGLKFKSAIYCEQGRVRALQMSQMYVTNWQVHVQDLASLWVEDQREEPMLAAAMEAGSGDA